jgi:hypothetical protein
MKSRWAFCAPMLKISACHKQSNVLCGFPERDFMGSQRRVSSIWEQLFFANGVEPYAKTAGAVMNPTMTPIQRSARDDNRVWL